MSRKGFKADPLRNEGDLRVFYCLASKGIISYPPGGKIEFRSLNTPSEIARVLGVKTPTVLEHLEKLMDVGFVKRGERKGRTQEYVVNWGKVIEKFFRESEIGVQLSIDRGEGVTKWEKETVKALKRIRESEKIQSIIIAYFKKHLPQSIFEMTDGKLIFLETPTFYEAVHEFESEIVKLKFEEARIEDEDVRRLLKNWQDYLSKTHTLAGSGARSAFLELSE